MSMSEVDQLFAQMLARESVKRACSESKDVYADAAEKSKKLYEAHIKVGFTTEEALALTCALLQ